jgi:branched-chain amino acid transport system ATP-binding protein
MTEPFESTDGTPDREGETLLSVEDIHAGYDDTKVLRGLSFSVQSGETVALIGRNGAGKTTTLRSLLGVIPPRAGSITFDGTDITSLSPEQSTDAGLAFVPEERRIFPGLSVRENLEVAELGRTSGSIQRDIEDVFARFERLADRRSNPGQSLSGGEQQMLAIARALVGGASLLMLDEPTEGLAPNMIEQVVDIVENLNEQGLTVLLVEQRVPVAMSIADYVYVLDRGQIVFEGTPTDLEANPDVLDQNLGISPEDI